MGNRKATARKFTIMEVITRVIIERGKKRDSGSIMRHSGFVILDNLRIISLMVRGSCSDRMVVCMKVFFWRIKGMGKGL